MSDTPPKDPIAALRYLSPILEAQGNSQIAGALILCADQLEREVAELREESLRLNALSWAFVRFFEQHAAQLMKMDGWDDLSLAFHANASREAEKGKP